MSTKVAPSGRQRVTLLVEHARKLLLPYASLPEPFFFFQENKIFKQLGGLDGIGAILKIASFQVHDDQMADAEFARFDYEGMKLTEDILNSLLNYLVLNSLLLTIFVALAVLHATRTYEVDQSSTGEVLLADVAVERSLYADVATFAWPNDPIAQRNLRRCFHWVESAMLAIGISFCVWSVHLGQNMYAIMGAGLPSTVAKCEYMLENPAELFTIFFSFQQGLNFVHLVLIFFAARVSAVAFLCMVASAVVVHLFLGVHAHTPNGPLNAKHKAQHREAQRVTHGLNMGRIADTTDTAVSD